MPQSPTANPVTRAYCNTEDIRPYIQPLAIDGSIVTTARVLEEIETQSRILDGMLGSRARTPFPARTSTSPKTPAQVKRWTTLMVAHTVDNWNRRINRSESNSTGWLTDALAILREEDGELKGSLMADSLMEFVAAETLGGDTLDGASQEWGWLGNTPYLRLRNPGLIVDATHPLKFLDSNGYEIRDTAGLPYSPSRLWKVHDAAQGVIFVLDYSSVQANAASVSYWFTYWDHSWFNSGGPAELSGVSTYGG